MKSKKKLKESARTLTLVALSFFSHCSLSFSMSVTLNRRSVTSWYKPWGGERNSRYPLKSGEKPGGGGFMDGCVAVWEGER